MKLGAAILALMLGASIGRGQIAPTRKVQNCTIAGCHAGQLDHAFVHGPTAVSACDVCHDYLDPARHTFVLRRQGRQLCDFCHIDQHAAPGSVVHEPFATGDCTACHDPHGSAVRSLIKAPSTNALCASCHDGHLNGAHIHKPAGEDCTACHRSHASSHPGLLTSGTRELCVGCHQDVGKEIDGAPHPHEPSQGDCLRCHQPHSSDVPKALNREPAELCLSCHEPIGKTIAAASHPHSAVSDARACLNCHTPHASRHKNALLDNPASACLACHAKPIVIDQKRTIRSMAEVGADGMHKHGPIAQGDCQACHTVHGGAHAGLLAMAYDDRFYQPYTDAAYGLCFKCHDRSSVLESGTETGFRNGFRNLHALHVAGSPQGRSCRSCHDTHASASDKLVAGSVAFGQWNMPINFVRSETGGSCGPGCHKPQSYDRAGGFNIPAAAPEPPR